MALGSTESNSIAKIRVKRIVVVSLNKTTTFQKKKTGIFQNLFGFQAENRAKVYAFMSKVMFNLVLKIALLVKIIELN